MSEYNQPNWDVPDAPTNTDVPVQPQEEQKHLYLKRTVEALAIGAEVSPANEAARIAVFGLAQVAAGNALMGALSYGGSTLVIEGAAALAAADYLANRQKRVSDDEKSLTMRNRASAWVESKVEKVVPTGSKMPLAVEAGVAFLGGSAVTMWVKDRQVPGRDRAEQARYGLRWSAIMSGVCAVQGALMAEGISHPDPKTIGVAFLGMGGIPALAGWAKNRFSRESLNALETAHLGYSQLLESLNSLHPQRQGLSREEFEIALNSNEVIKAKVVCPDGSLIEVPQLAPVKYFEWLNEDYYSRKFENEFNSGNLWHFTDFPEQEGLDERVEDALIELARNNGVLVFDAPSSDPEYVTRIVNRLAEAGIDGKVELLGTQTYFAGRLKLKREHEKRVIPLTFSEAGQLQAHSNASSQSDMAEGQTISYESSIDEHEASQMRQFFSDAYKQISDHPCSQAIGPEEFGEMVSDPDVAKIVCRNDGRAESMCLVTEDLDRLTWINPRVYSKLFPDKYPKKQVVWFPGIATDPNPDVVGHNVPRIVEKLAELAELGDNEAVVVFDTPDANTGFLDKYLEDEISKLPQTSIEFEAIGDQKYYAVRLAIKE